MPVLQTLLAAVYVVLPLAAAATAALRARREQSFRPLASFLITCGSGFTFGVVWCLICARIAEATVPLSQLAVTCYLAVGVMVAVKSASWVLKQGLERAFVVHAAGWAGRRRDGWWVARMTGAIVVRSAILVLLALPYMMGVALVYRPRTVGGGVDPQAILPGAAVEQVAFRSTDGVRLAGWWIPARPPPDPVKAPADWGTRTVIVCHGSWATKSTYLTLARDLWPNGYNVLAFDFRAHGDSGGHTFSFGDRERQDVLGAVRWALATHPENCREVYGVGVDTGGAALLAAAGDASPEGRAIAAVAVLGTFDRLGTLLDRRVDEYLTPPLAWLARRLALPVANFHAGSDLPAFAPGELVDRIAPRPVLVVHARGDTRVPFDAGYRLFDRASVPRFRYWVGETDASGQWVIRANPRTRVDQQGVTRYPPAEGVTADQVNLVSDEDTVRAIRAVFELGKQVV